MVGMDDEEKQILNSLKKSRKRLIKEYCIYFKLRPSQLALQTPVEIRKCVNEYYNVLLKDGLKETTVNNYIHQIIKVYNEFHSNLNLKKGEYTPTKSQKVRTRNRPKPQGAHNRKHKGNYKWKMEDKKVLNKFCEERNLQDSTFKGYISALKCYCGYFNMGVKELIDEALNEQDKYIPLRKTKLKKRLLEFREGIIKTEIGVQTQKTYVSKILSFYRHFEIEIPVLPQMNYELEYVTSYTDLPTHAQIQSVLDTVDIQLKAVILFQTSSGSAKAETLSLKVKQFIDGVKPYTTHKYMHTCESVKKILDSLNFITPEVVPQFYLSRIKTKKYYYTFCSPEAAEAITSALLQRLNTVNDIEKFMEEPLFPFSSSKLLNCFQEINDNMNWGFKGKYRFFRSHVLRKFNASNIGMVSEDIDAIQGRSKNVVHAAYIKTNPTELKSRYMKHMWRVAINPEWKEKEMKFDPDSMKKYGVSSSEEKIANKIIDSLHINPTQKLSKGTVTPTGSVQLQEGNIADELLKFAQLTEKGFLSRGEFNILKNKLLGDIL